MHRYRQFSQYQYPILIFILWLFIMFVYLNTTWHIPSRNKQQRGGTKNHYKYRPSFVIRADISCIPTCSGVQSCMLLMYPHSVCWPLCRLLVTAPPTVYVWQQHVCAAARRGCDGVRDTKGDRGGESDLNVPRLQRSLGVSLRFFLLETLSCR